MAYKLKRWLLIDIRTGWISIVRARSRRSLEKRLGKRANEVIIQEVKDGK